MKNVGHRSLTAIVNLEMSPRLLENTKWLSCFLVLSGFPSWHSVSSVAVNAPPKGPATIEAQAKFFQDFFSVQLSPYKMEFGHVCEDPNTWEQRYEKKDFKTHRDMGKTHAVEAREEARTYRHLPNSEDYDQGHRQGSEKHFTERHERARPGEGLFSAKVRWGDKQGGYGEHYWDLNHAGHVGDQGNDNDDGSYNSQEHNDSYDGPSEQVSTFNDEYDAEKAAQSPFDENNRAKRAQPRLRQDKAAEIVYGKKKTKDLYIKNREESIKKKQEEEEASDETKSNEDEDQDYNPREEYSAPTQRKSKPAKITRFKTKEINYDEDDNNSNSPVHTAVPEQTKQHTHYTDQKAPFARNTNYGNDQNNPTQSSYAEQKHPQRNQYAADLANPQGNFEQETSTQTRTPYVPYESGAGVRQHYQQQFAASAARLFLDPATGNVVDRTTGQAYVLQPISVNY